MPDVGLVRYNVGSVLVEEDVFLCQLVGEPRGRLELQHRGSENDCKPIYLLSGKL